MFAPKDLPQHEVIRLYCGVCEDDWNGEPVEAGPFVCISPVYGRSITTRSVNYVKLSENTPFVIQDSGAFCDGPGYRLSVEQALERQIVHADRFGYAARVTHRGSYDVLIDEKWGSEGRRYTCRWSEAEAWDACIATIQAARYLSRHRHGLRCILSAQGVTPAQYLKCVAALLPYLEHGDKLGLGGWCIVGKRPWQMLPVFRETMRRVIPFVGQEGVKEIHLWGCLYAPALGELLALCDQHGIRLSVDSVGPSLRPVLGKWGYASWTDPTYKYRRPVGSQLGRHRRLHVYLVRRWLRDFRRREQRHYWIGRSSLYTQQRLIEDLA